MIEQVALKEEDFLQQFPRVDEYTQDGLAFSDWWESGEDPNAVGKPINLAAMFGGAQMTQA
jgi:hypothetical protein